LVVLAGSLLVAWFSGGGHWYCTREAELAIHKRESQQAIDWLQLADDSSPRTHYLLARAYRRQGDVKSVHEHLKRAKELGFTRELLQREQWLMMAQLGRLRESEKSLTHLMRGDDPHPGEICEALVTGYLRQYRFDDAGIVIDAWKADYPDDPQPHFCLGMVWVHLQTWRKAAAEFRLALDIDSNHHRARIEFARSLTELQKFEEAIASYKVCLEIPEISTQARIGLASCYLPLGNPAKARKMLEQILATDSTHQAARTLMGELCLMDGSHKEAIVWLEPALEKRPNDPVLRHQYAVALHAANRHEEADQHDSFVEEANAAIEAAIVLMDQLREKSDGAEPRFKIGSTLVKYGSPDEGLLWLKSALEVDPGHISTHEVLAEYFESIDQLDSAKHHRETLKRLKR
jgi:Tfp pilus assembly protein PilF